MLEARPAVGDRYPYIYHVIKGSELLLALTAKRDIFVYDVRKIISNWFGGKEPVLPHLSESDVARLQRPEAILILDWSGEGRPLNDNAFSLLAAWAERKRVSLSKVIFIDQNPVPKTRLFRRWAQKVGCTEMMRFGFAHAWMDWTIAQTARTVRSSFVQDTIDSVKTHRFLSLNNAPRPHRVMMLSLMQERARGSELASLSLLKDTTRVVMDQVNSQFRGAFAAREIAAWRASPSFMRKYGNLVDAFDVTAVATRCRLPPVGGPTMFMFDEQNYVPTILSIVGESEMSAGDFLRVTEKSFKPALFGHSFIIVGNPQSYRLMERFGIETFPELFSQASDSINDPVARLEAVMDVVAELAVEPLDSIRDRVASVRGKVIANANYVAKELPQRYKKWLALHIAYMINGGPGIDGLNEILK